MKQDPESEIEESVLLLHRWIVHFVLDARYGFTSGSVKLPSQMQLSPSARFDCDVISSCDRLNLDTVKVLHDVHQRQSGYVRHVMNDAFYPEEVRQRAKAIVDGLFGSYPDPTG
jgi:hypothetical protein